LPCPICQKRKAKRFCPAKGEAICSVCCGTEREVTIDCPWDCPYLVSSRQYDQERAEIDWTKVPFSETKVPSSFVASHESLLLALTYRICVYARENPQLADPGVRAALEALAETYRTLSSGIYYERPPDYVLERGLYDALKAILEDYKKAPAQQLGLAGARDSEIRDALVFLAQLAAVRSNGRPKGRATIDFLRRQFKSEEFSKPASPIVTLP